MFRICLDCCLRLFRKLSYSCIWKEWNWRNSDSRRMSLTRWREYLEIALENMGYHFAVFMNGEIQYSNMTGFLGNRTPLVCFTS